MKKQLLHVYLPLMLAALLALVLPDSNAAGSAPSDEGSVPSASAQAADSATPETPKSDAPLRELPYVPSLDLSAMDRSADPCVDFYQYVCGGWVVNNPIPPDQASWSVFGKVYEENQQYLWGILEDTSKPDPARDPSQQKIGDYFNACMDEGAVEKAGVAPLQERLAELEGIESMAGLARFASHQHLASYSGVLFAFGAAQDPRDSSQFIPVADAGGLGLPDRDYYLNTDEKSVETREHYVAHVQKMLELLGDSKRKAKAGAQDVLRLETALAQASLTRVDRRDPYKIYHKMTLQEVQALMPSFPWDVYLAANSLPEYAVFNVMEPDFFKALESRLESEKLATWKTYLKWHLAHAWAPYLSSSFVQENFVFYSQYLRGIDSKPLRWKRCVGLVDRDLGEALGQVFVEKTVSPDVKTKTLKMAEDILWAMEQELGQLPWMGPETRKQALEKLHTMVNKIGWPDQWRDYSSVTITRDDFAGNVARATVFESRRQLAKIGKPIDRGEWQMTPPSVNAYYDPQMNDMNFPAGVLQPPMLDLKLDDAPNYGDTGSTIGHELTHGFDDEGRNYDAYGNLRDWWTPEDATAFRQQTQCVEDQYAEYVVIDDIKINSKLTLGEDVADLGGTLLAYMAWKHATEGQDLQPRDGFTPDQRFFIGFAQWACTNQRDEMTRLLAITDPHSPPRYRVNGVVADLPEFQQAFSCKEGQPMVSKNPCKVW